MNLQEIRAIAKQLSLKTNGSSKTDLVRKIQLEEGNFDCYATASSGSCDQAACLWRKDCFAAARE